MNGAGRTEGVTGRGILTGVCKITISSAFDDDQPLIEIILGRPHRTVVFDAPLNILEISRRAPGSYLDGELPIEVRHLEENPA